MGRGGGRGLPFPNLYVVFTIHGSTFTLEESLLLALSDITRTAGALTDDALMLVCDEMLPERKADTRPPLQEELSLSEAERDRLYGEVVCSYSVT